MIHLEDKELIENLPETSLEFFRDRYGVGCQKKLAEVLDIPETTISGWMNSDKIGIGHKLLRLLVHIYNVEDKMDDIPGIHEEYNQLHKDLAATTLKLHEREREYSIILWALEHLQGTQYDLNREVLDLRKTNRELVEKYLQVKQELERYDD